MPLTKACLRFRLLATSGLLAIIANRSMNILLFQDTYVSLEETLGLT
jgi:hypothetical protein